MDAPSLDRRGQPVRSFSLHRKKAPGPVGKSDLAMKAAEEGGAADPPRGPKAPPQAAEPDPIKGLIEKHQAAPAESPAAQVPLPARSRPGLDQKIGQMIVVGFAGTKSGDPGVVEVRRQIAQGIIGGVMLMGQNVVAPGQTAQLNRAILASSPRGGLRPIISVDQEGGFVQRLSLKNGHSAYPSAWAVANDARYGSSDRAQSVYERMARELSASGFNTNFGPVVDLNLFPQNPIIGRYKRSFSDEPGKVIDYARAFCLAHEINGLLTSAKHFPGHGSSRADSHKGFTDIGKWWKDIELEPYRDLAKDQFVDMIMVGHLYHQRFADAPGVPASLSQKAIGYLKSPQKIGFKGVVVTDDMEMGAVRKNFGFEESIVRAVNSGVDILLYSNTATPSPKLGPRIHGVIRKAVDDGRIDPKRIDDAYARIAQMKQKLTKKRAFEAEESASVPAGAARDAVH